MEIFRHFSSLFVQSEFGLMRTRIQHQGGTNEKDRDPAPGGNPGPLLQFAALFPRADAHADADVHAIADIHGNPDEHTHPDPDGNNRTA